MSHKKGEGSRQSNNLTATQITRLYAWIDESRAWASVTTAQRIAVKAAEELHFGVTMSNVLSAKKALDIVKPVKQPPVAPACRCRELAKAWTKWFDSERAKWDEAELRSAVRDIIAGIPPDPVAPELPLTSGPCACAEFDRRGEEIERLNAEIVSRYNAMNEYKQENDALRAENTKCAVPTRAERRRELLEMTAALINLPAGESWPNTEACVKYAREVLAAVDAALEEGKS
jgi:hypothetical protein